MPTKCIFKVREIESPISKDPRGFRFLVALPNNAGHTLTGEPCPLFDKPYLITIFGDYCSLPDVMLHLPRIVRTLNKMGYTL